MITELFYHRKTVAEAAALLGIPEGTVRSRCFYALRALRQLGRILTGTAQAGATAGKQERGDSR